MRIAIAGLGMTGSYLYKLLSEEGYRVDVYEVDRNTKCGLHPCAWGTSRGFSDLVRRANLDPNKYILNKFDQITFGDVKIPADIMTIDKPRLVHDLSESAEITYANLNPSRYERVIDATGLSRAFLPKLESDLVIRCVQYRIASNNAPQIAIKPGGGGYAWNFPLGGGEVHVGCGSLYNDPGTPFSRLEGDSGKIKCGCSSNMRITGPNGSRPFFVADTPEIWGVGEAIGCVSPIAGDGIVPGMTSAKILLDNWEDPKSYTDSILEEFGWMEKERKIVDKIASGKQPSLTDARVILENARRMGIKINIINALKLARSLL
jgi:flavin-dependent dehydrogenase